MRRVAIVDTGLCNLDSMRRALEECGADPFVAAAPDELGEAERFVLPGVGAFPDAMRSLRERGLDTALRRHVVDARLPILGVCLGMQLLASEGTEMEPTPGLGWVSGRVVRLEPQPGERVPHVGWNDVVHSGHPLFEGIESGRAFYFVHSFQLVPGDPAARIATTDAGGGCTAAVARGNIAGVQFHPEKSQKAGFQLLRNFLAWTP
jgi:glutamine amidotransferase